MTKLTLTNRAQSNTVVLENEFIDLHMPKANGEYVKVYLLLLRHLNDSSGNLTISKIADILDDTEKDVIRALNYWKKLGLLDYETAETMSTQVSPTVSTDLPLQEPVSVDNSDLKATPNIQQYRNRKARTELKELLFVAEQYLGKTLSTTEIDTITYFFDTLHLSTDLIEYLIEYCVENGHKSMHYIQKVALSWSAKHITTVTQAKANTLVYNKNCYSVLNAYGIKGRVPAASEIVHIKRWNEEYCFSLDIILEACARTMSTIHQPSFDYTDTILKNWLGKGVKSLKDIETLDSDYLREKEKKKIQNSKPIASTKATNNKFNNFNGRTYDMDDLERKLVQQ